MAVAKQLCLGHALEYFGGKVESLQQREPPRLADLKDQLVR